MPVIRSGRILLIPVTVFLLFFSVNLLIGQVKREMRAVWIATVTNIDWPISRFDAVAKQKTDLTNLLDNLQSAGINCVIFQIRPECDALYVSSIEPWSYWLTGQQGKIPDPFYDPLEFAITEAHARGMELHAWFNPYRAERSVGSYALSPNHVVYQHPDWILYFSKINQNLLDPGLQSVRDFVTEVIVDVVSRYNVDGVHFDDYFYPYPNSSVEFPGITTEDAATFANYPRGFTDIGDWRRDNVNLLVAQVNGGIKSIKPYVKFGISPFGIWKNGVPAGIIGLDAYSEIYADALSWISSNIIDYLTPQLYWPFGGNQDYGKLLPWWAGQMNERHLYPGQAAYRLSIWQPDEIPRQIRLNRNTAHVFGSVYFSAKRVLSNINGFTDSLKTDYYRLPALRPTMTWLDSIPPNEPGELSASNMAEGIQLSWLNPDPAADGDTAMAYVIYRFDAGDSANFDDPENIMSIIPGNEQVYLDDHGTESQIYAYYVTSLDRLHNESQPSNRVEYIYTSIEQPKHRLPISDMLAQNYPNPFNPETRINFIITRAGMVKLYVYDALGRIIAKLVDKDLDRGSYSVYFIADDLPTGIYYYRLVTETFSSTKKMMLIK